MIRSIKTHHTSIGVSIGAHAISMIQLVRSGSAWRVHASCRYRRMDTQTPELTLAEAQRLKDFVLIKGFHGNRLTLCPPHELTQTCLIELPTPPLTDPVAFIHQEFARVHAHENKGFEVAAWSVSNQQKDAASSEVFTVGCAHQAIEPTLDRIESTGLRITRLGSVPTALAAYAQQSQADQTSPLSAIVDINTGQTTLTLVHENTAFYHSLLPCGGLYALLDRAQVGPPSTLAVYQQWLTEQPALKGNLHHRAFENILQQIACDLAATVNLDLKRAAAYVNQRHPGQSIQALILTGEGVANDNTLGSTIRQSVSLIPVRPHHSTDGTASALGLLASETQDAWLINSPGQADQQPAHERRTA